MGLEVGDLVRVTGSIGLLHWNEIGEVIFFGEGLRPLGTVVEVEFENGLSSVFGSNQLTRLCLLEELAWRMDG